MSASQRPPCSPSYPTVFEWTPGSLHLLRVPPQHLGARVQSGEELTQDLLSEDVWFMLIVLPS